MKGGYQILDLKNTVLTDGGAAVLVPGVYEVIEGNYRKPILLEGLVVSTTECAAQFVSFGLSSTDFVATVLVDGTEMALTIDDDDKVSIATIV